MLGRGEVLAGDYVIDALLGKGGMGCVYRAHVQEQPSVAVAIKELPPTVRLSSGQLVAQGISSQMRLMKRVNHPHIAKLLDAFLWNGSFYFVFEYVAGRSLQSIVATSGALPERQALEYARELCDILGYLHGLEPAVVYRDMKPSNVLLDDAGALNVVDLGIAREFKAADDQRKDTVAFGTQGYAPPEQYGCAQTDARSDIYALGCTLWHLLAGCPPPMEFPLPSVRTVNPQVSEACDALIQRCTQLDRAARYQTCAHLAHDVQRILDSQVCGDDPAGEGARNAVAGGAALAGAADAAPNAEAAEGISALCAADQGAVGEGDGPAERLATAFKRLLKPWPTHAASESGAAGVPVAAAASGATAVADVRDAVATPGEPAHGSKAADARGRGARGVLGATANSLDGTQNNREDQVFSFLRTNRSALGRSEIAEYCFAHADALLGGDVPTTLLDNLFEEESRPTGDLLAAPAVTSDFFFTIVQTDLCAHDDADEPDDWEA